MEGDINPIFRWAGSKRKLLPRLLTCVPEEYGTYIEPFAGSACLFFALDPQTSILGDFNPELIHAYEQICRYPRRIHQHLVEMPDTAVDYYRIRALSPDKLSMTKRAARFIYLNRFCFNGVYRTNKQGKFNVPRGRDTGEKPTLMSLRTYANRLKKARLCSTDFLETLAQVAPGDFVYLDPPYTKADQPYSGEYGYGAFGANDLGRLIPELQRIHDLGATFLFSYRYTPLLYKELHKWERKIVSVRRHVAGFSSSRRVVREMLISNRPFSELPS